eukprot:COSAG01_NODE_8844_length_2639_cov_1.566535_3_plen_71_part_00
MLLPLSLFTSGVSSVQKGLLSHGCHSMMVTGVMIIFLILYYTSVFMSYGSRVPYASRVKAMHNIHVKIAP